MGDTSRPELLTVDEALALDVATITELSRRHLGSGQHRRMQLLAFDTMLAKHAKDMYYLDAHSREVLDLSGGFGALATGHNHPRILAVRRCLAERRSRHAGPAFASRYAAALATNLARISPGDLDVVQLCRNGSEAIAGAVRLARLAQGPRRSQVAYVSRSRYGGAPAAPRVADSTHRRSGFGRTGGAVWVPFGDTGALAAALRKRRIGTLLMETVQGSAGVLPPPSGYLREVRRLCDKHGVLWIADEVHCGTGRTGRFFAFEHDGVLPDIVTLARSLGGGAVSVGAVIARRGVPQNTGPDTPSAMAPGTATLSRTGDAYCTAIEELSVLYDEDLIGNAERTGRYLRRRLEGLRLSYPDLVTDIRGMGLMVGIQLAGISAGVAGDAYSAARLLNGDQPGGLAGVVGGLAGVVGSLLLAEHGVLVTLTEHDRDVLRLEPPLTIQPQHVDEFVDSLDELLSRGMHRLMLDYLSVVRGSSPDTVPVQALPATSRQ